MFCDPSYKKNNELMKMLLSNAKRLKIQGIIKRIAQDKSITLEERIYVEKFAQHNSTISQHISSLLM